MPALVTNRATQTAIDLGNPMRYGASGGGSVDDTTVVALANSRSGGYVYLPPGKTFRVTSNTNLGTLIASGGRLSIDSGVTVTFDGMIGDPARVVFTGSGSARPTNNNYSVGWYDGSTLNAKWDMCRRAFTTNQRKVIVFPAPYDDDPAASVTLSTGTIVWNVTSPLQFDDPENNAEVYQFAAFYGATQGMSCVVECSPTNKTEDIYWRTGIIIDGGNNAVDGIRAHGGARMQYVGYSSIGRVIRDAVHYEADTVGVADFSEPTFDFLNVTNFGRRGVHIEGQSGRVPLGVMVSYLFSNGAKGLYCTATVSAGAITSLSIDTNGPNGSAQVRSGFGYAGQTFKIYSKNGSGYGATATATVSGGTVTGFTVTGGGSGFVDGETVSVSSADCYLYLGGVTRSCHCGRIYVYQDDSANLVDITDAIVILDSTTHGSTQNFTIGNIASQRGTRAALIAKDTSGATASKHRIAMDGVAIPGNVQDGGAYVQLDWTDEARVRGLRTQVTQNAIASVTSTCQRIGFINVPRERVSGNCDYLWFDGIQIYYNTSMAIDSAASVPLEAFSGSGSLHTIEVISNSAGGYYAGLNRDNNALIDMTKGSGVDTSTSVLSGTTGSSGKFTVSAANGRLYFENRLPSALRVKVAVSH